MRKQSFFGVLKKNDSSEYINHFKIHYSLRYILRLIYVPSVKSIIFSENEKSIFNSTHLRKYYEFYKALDKNQS